MSGTDLRSLEHTKRTHAARSRLPPHRVHVLINIHTKQIVMDSKSWLLLCLLFICQNVCQCNKQEEEQEEHLMEQKKLKGADQEKELVVAAIYKVGALSQQIYRWT